jgi:hypothetical protein
VSWETLWRAVFYAAFAAFVVISLLIAVFGLAEIRETFASWRTRRDGGGPRQG